MSVLEAARSLISCSMSFPVLFDLYIVTLCMWREKNMAIRRSFLVHWALPCAECPAPTSTMPCHTFLASSFRTMFRAAWSLKFTFLSDFIGW